MQHSQQGPVANKANPAGPGRQRLKAPGDDLRHVLGQPETLATATVAAIIAAVLIPGSWLLTLTATFVYALWARRLRFRLPFRLPAFSTARDYSNPVPGQASEYRRGTGILYLGNDAESGEELWISNSDARRHAFVLGTTGAGKALPEDTLVLTPAGWHQNGKIKEGDQVIHPSGKAVSVVSVHRQGLLPVVKLHFIDGRVIRCSRDHLWQVRIAATGLATRLSESEDRCRTAGDLGLQLHMDRLQNGGNGALRFSVPLPSPLSGPLPAVYLTRAAAVLAAKAGLGALPFLPSLAGSSTERIAWLRLLLRRRGGCEPFPAGEGWLRLPVLDAADGWRLRQVIWSLGGIACEISDESGRYLRAQFPDQSTAVEGGLHCDEQLHRRGLEIVDIEGSASTDELQSGAAAHSDRYAAAMAARSRHAQAVPMLCIKTDAEDGLFVIENYIPTHNTELLLGLATQTMMWSSGFLFVDGKGTNEFHARAWSLACRFGRQDDYCVLNFTDGGGHPDASALTSFGFHAANSLI